MDVGDARPILRIALEVALGALDDAPVGGRVDVVHGAADGCQPAGDERLAEALGRDRQVGHRGEAAEALAEHAPAVDAELGADRLRVADDRIGAEVGQVPGLRLGRVARDDGADRGGPAGPALVDQQHAVVGQGARDPSAGRRGRSRGLHAGTALEEQEIGPVEAVRVGHLAGEHRDRRPGGPGMVERDDVLAFGQDRPGNRGREGHRAMVTAPGASACRLRDAWTMTNDRPMSFGVFRCAWLMSIPSRLPIGSPPPSRARTERYRSPGPGRKREVSASDATEGSGRPDPSLDRWRRSTDGPSAPSDGPSQP